MDLNDLPVWFVPGRGFLGAGFWGCGVAFLLGTLIIALGVMFARRPRMSLVAHGFICLAAVLATFVDGYRTGPLFFYMLAGVSLGVLWELFRSKTDGSEVFLGVTAVSATSCYYLHLLCALALMSV